MPYLQGESTPGWALLVGAFAAAWALLQLWRSYEDVQRAGSLPSVKSVLLSSRGVQAVLVLLVFVPLVVLIGLTGASSG